MNKLNTLPDGLLDQIRDLHSAGNQLLKTLPKLAAKASNQRLKEALRLQLLETEGQLERLDEIGSLLLEKVIGKTCKAMQGLLDETEDALEADSDNTALIDTLLIASARRLTHYQMAAYCTTRAIAHELGQDKVAKLLEESLEEQRDMDRRLVAILKAEVLFDANSSSEFDDEKRNPQPDPVLKLESLRKSTNATRLFGFLSFLLTTQFYLFN